MGMINLSFFFHYFVTKIFDVINLILIIFFKKKLFFQFVFNMFKTYIIKTYLRKITKFLNNKHFYAFALFIFLDYVLIPKLFSFLLYENLSLEEINPNTFKRVTIKELIHNISRRGAVVQQNDMLSAIPHRNDKNADEQNSFIYQRAVCNALKRVKGLRNNFRICYPPRTNETGKMAYFINGQRDSVFEMNFKAMLFKNTKLKLFLKGDPSNDTDTWPDEVADVIEDIHVTVYTEANEDENGQRIQGIKDLIDERDNYHMMEFLKYEMENTTDPLVFSINTPVYAPHLLLRLHRFAYEELRYLIKRLAYTLYFPYSVQHDSTEGVHYVSFMHQFSMNKYDFDGLIYAKWSKKKVKDNRTYHNHNVTSS